LIFCINLSYDINQIKDKIYPEDGRIKTIILNDTLFMSAHVKKYDIMLAENLNDVLNIRKEQIYLFVRLSVLFSFIIAFSLYIIIYLLTRKINKLNKVVEKISKGNYDSRVKKLGTDEIGELAISFNKMAMSIEENIKEIEKISENRQNFINNITHEIRTPLTSIIGYSSLIKNGKVYEKEKILQYNNKIYEEGNYLNLISQRLVDIVLLDNKEIELKNVELSKVIKKIIDNIKSENYDIKFIEKIQEEIVINSDETLVYSLVLNLIKNAVMAYDEADVKVIEIVLNEIEEDIVRLEIIDKGKGMTDEQISKILEPFYTLNKDRNRQISGMGLGLPLCQKICTVLKADLKIQSILESGTTVNIEFYK